jgi:hypothetical protein
MGMTRGLLAPARFEQKQQFPRQPPPVPNRPEFASGGAARGTRESHSGCQRVELWSPAPRKREACDGFVLTPTISPVMWEEFTCMLTPELQRRGLLRTAYAGITMRENLRS